LRAGSESRRDPALAKRFQNVSQSIAKKNKQQILNPTNAFGARKKSHGYPSQSKENSLNRGKYGYLKYQDSALVMQGASTSTLKGTHKAGRIPNSEMVSPARQE